MSLQIRRGLTYSPSPPLSPVASAQPVPKNRERGYPTRHRISLARDSRTGYFFAGKLLLSQPSTLSIFDPLRVICIAPPKARESSGFLRSSRSSHWNDFRTHFQLRQSTVGTLAKIFPTPKQTRKPYRKVSCFCRLCIFYEICSDMDRIHILGCKGAVACRSMTRHLKVALPKDRLTFVPNSDFHLRRFPNDFNAELAGQLFQFGHHLANADATVSLIKRNRQAERNRDPPMRAHKQRHLRLLPWSLHRQLPPSKLKLKQQIMRRSRKIFKHNSLFKRFPATVSDYDKHRLITAQTANYPHYCLARLRTPQSYVASSLDFNAVHCRQGFVYDVPGGRNACAPIH
jgi:hypothetical protein